MKYAVNKEERSYQSKSIDLFYRPAEPSSSRGRHRQAQTVILDENWAGASVADTFAQGVTDGMVTSTGSGLTWDIKTGANAGLLDFTGEKMNISVVRTGAYMPIAEMRQSKRL